jgi:diadenosine tetraphosphate (Ap4A) HIT family hydrolase
MMADGDPADQTEEWNRYRSCFFCYHPREGEIVATEHLSVVYDDSPIVEGHVMIHSRQHWGCAGELPSAQIEELATLKQAVGKMLLEAYGCVAFYEHGRAGHCSSWAGGPECEHFHLHALPIDISIESVLASRFRPVLVDGYRAIAQAFETHGDYLYFEDAHGKISFFPATGEIESHALRTMIANAVGDPAKSNWEGMRNPEMVDACRRKLEKIRPQVEQHARAVGIVSR